MKTVLDTHWFARFELVLASGCAAFWYFEPQFGAWILPLAFAPWLLRLISGRFPYHRTKLDIPVFVFLGMALVGVWAAYNREIAIAKLWILLSGILLFYALASQPQANWSLVMGSLALLGAFIAAYFMLVYNWQAQPVDLDPLNRIGLGWMKVRPSIQQAQPDHNRVGGVLALLTPFVFAGVWKARRERRIRAMLLSITCGILVLVGLLMSGSRAAWLALGISVGICVSISSGRRLLTKNEHIRSRFTNVRKTAYVLTLMVAVILLVGEFSFHSNKIDIFLNDLGVQESGSRLTLYQNSIFLIPDFLYTGAGLGAFPGIYSHYVMLIPDYLFGYSHNLFLDIALEQGLLSSLAVIVIILGSFRVLFAASEFTPNHWVVLLGTMVLFLQGLAGDAFYGNPGTPFLFLMPGLVFMFAGEDPDKLFTPRKPYKIFGMQRSLVLASLIIGGFSLSYIFKNQLLSAWYTDLGAVQMARVELKNWTPLNTVRQFELSELARSEALFRQALQLEPQNQSAQYRLGLIALDRGDFKTAVDYLEPGYLAGNRRRGLEKALGYSYTWSGQVDLGANLLAKIPEARQELGVYSWWWGTQDREDLAQRAAQMADLLAVNSPDQN